MPGLSEVHQLIHRALRQELTSAEAAAQLGVSAERLQLYVDFVQGAILSVLQKNYPTARHLLGSQRWAEVALRYFRERPARHVELNQCVSDFPEFLASIGTDPFVCSVASFEWAEFEVTVGPPPDPASTLNSTVRILELPVPVVATMVRWHGGQRDPLVTWPGLSDGPERLLMFQFDESMSFYLASDGLLFALKVAHDRLDPLEAARSAGLPEDAALAAWNRATEIGLVMPTPKQEIV